jgi:hypothetical protein
MTAPSEGCLRSSKDRESSEWKKGKENFELIER